MRYHLIGIKGSGMSALACILKEQKNDVTGSDIEKEIFTQVNLDKHDITYFNFDKNNISSDIDEVIVGNVFDETNVEFSEALRLNIKITKYTDFLKTLTSKYNTIAICGTNGKTTTTSMVNCSLSDENKMTLIGDSKGYSTISPEIFILEACEYKGNFLNYNCDICVINNIEMDHPDYFTDIDHVIDTFYLFAKKATTIILNNDDLNCHKVYQKLNDKEIITFGIDEKSDIYATNITKNSNGYVIDLHYGDETYNDVLIPFYGQHMLYNSLATIAVSYALKHDFNYCYKNLIKFDGATRRFEETIISKENNVILIDDYAHHPTSVKLTLDAIRQKYPEYSVSTIFQAHTFSRVKEFGKEFGKVLNESDFIYIAQIFGSIREQQSTVDLNVITDEINKDKLIKDVKELNKIKNNHIIALLGAGDIDKLYKEQVIKLFKENNESN